MGLLLCVGNLREILKAEESSKQTGADDKNDAKTIKALLCLSEEEKMFDILGLLCLIWWCMMLFYPLHADIQCMGCMNGSAIENFSCVIYNISFMNCTWQAGRDAPGDTQYFLYWQNSRYVDKMECELYIKDENGRNRGCRFQNVKIETEKAYFLVNGSSKDSLIQLYDEYIELYEIGK
ncbi:granulocyte-macrophage colony-stimulating factor receptor subunit alpha-like [Grus japonensis]|uniref:Granulocyte-macrophage colony-stimulating factor receptor subunit alpha-like n=1 Tax=Grus japonensis TaxID=30415 RepID=A0ABC9VZI6_GRUJA